MQHISSWFWWKCFCPNRVPDKHSNYCFRSQNHPYLCMNKKNKQKWSLSKHQTCQKRNQILLLRVQFWKSNIFTNYFLRRFFSRLADEAKKNRFMKTDKCLLQVSCKIMFGPHCCKIYTGNCWDAPWRKQVWGKKAPNIPHFVKFRKYRFTLKVVKQVNNNVINCIEDDI